MSEVLCTCGPRRSDPKCPVGLEVGNHDLGVSVVVDDDVMKSNDPERLRECLRAVIESHHEASTEASRERKNGVAVGFAPTPPREALYFARPPQPGESIMRWAWGVDERAADSANLVVLFASGGNLAPEIEPAQELWKHEWAMRNRIIVKEPDTIDYGVILWFTRGDYPFDLDAVRVPQKYPGKKHYKGKKKGKLSGNPLGKNPGDVWLMPFWQAIERCKAAFSKGPIVKVGK